jgi:DNA repair protein RecN (Recombination protein N)
MLQTLGIRNLALLEQVSLDFEAGFTVVTGETGAGKSILLGALSLLAGERADKTIIRQGAASCEVEASLFFRDSRRIDALLAELDLPSCEDGLLILKRSLPREKPPKISVNGSMATLGSLQRLGEHWIDFHGPSEPRRLLKHGCQLELLDLYAGVQGVLSSYQELYGAWRTLLKDRAAIEQETKLSPEQIRYVESQLAKFEQVELTEESLETLERDFQRMSRGRELVELAGSIEGSLSGEDGVVGRVAAILRLARQLESLDPASRPLAERLQMASIELADLADEFGGLSSQFSFEPEEMERIQAGMNAWLELKRKYGGDLATVMKAREDMQRRLEVQGDLEGTLERLDRDIAQAEKRVREKAAELRREREKAAKDLAKLAAKSIAQLGFKKADFRVQVTVLPELGPTGDTGVEFLFSPNVGEAPLPLHRIASSGELARVMLALKTVLADLDEVPVLVFDEVDANVGGEIGRVVGEQMAKIARSHQVLCVTHLPQVAAQGNAHLLVEKDQSKDRAVVRIEEVHTKTEHRIDELARMLGDRTAKSARAHAEELLALGAK